ncbi:fungal-specific transcription factor domain-containing protein [Annulohypoxylon maeteangense]|uniref:fungal-specific transcription factor domain-containing protein n=1 Tax=Annulohypoxylon maeteangense TaxID=1927788 RepID=UPI002008125F|nr:fungal-specific transcription factor domain-containing protein [Annulohypoxylon maeteangense]KAI0879962.1 fungal-specific transcription factor domain-containing protein [Annulohypoxylon maeteangense]
MHYKEMEMALVTAADSAIAQYPEINKNTAYAQRPSPNRKSKGPGLRLSWPYASDGRRSVVGKSPPVVQPHKNGSRRASDMRIVHVSYENVEMHYHFSDLGPTESARPILHIPLAWNPSDLEVGEKNLFQYFQCTAAQSLATFGYNPGDLSGVLIRVALAGHTTSATAVLQSLLAFSSIHRHDVHSQAVELKISALKALAAAAGNPVGTVEAVQHVAAGMLLCSFEIHQSSCTSSQWTWYLSGVKDVIKAAGLGRSPQDNDLAILLDWVYYHDVLARFTLRHWHKESNAVTSAVSNARAEVSHAAPSAFSVIQLLSDVCDAVSARSVAGQPFENIDDHKSFLKILDWRIRSIPLEAIVCDSTDASLMIELYQLAMLVYLNRASENLLSQTTKTQHQIDKAFSIFSQLDSCDRQFPIFILGCEARGDDQRAIILDLITKTEKKASSRSFNYVKILLQAIWAQDDLANGHINYCDKLNYVISCCAIVPSFV